jgi:hypothetical protein
MEAVLDGGGSHWWLSFCDPGAPVGQKFLGCVITGPAYDVGGAAKCAWKVGCNPGKEVVGIAVPITATIPEEYTDRLLTKDEAAAVDAIWEKEHGPVPS